MPNTELFRDELLSELILEFSEEDLLKILNAFDKAAQNYTIEHKSYDLITTDGLPEEVKWFIASKSIANCSPKTLDQYRYRLVSFFTIVQKKPAEITTNDVRLYLYWYKNNRNVGNHTLEHIRLCLSSFFSWCLTENRITSNPMTRIERIKYQQPQREPLTSYELELLRWHCKHIREKALIDLLFSTGCRISECANIKLSDINWEERSIHIKHGKGDKERTVFFNAESELSLRKYLESRNDNCDGLFVSIKTPIHAIAPNALEKIIRKVGERAGVHAFPHKLRHTFATVGLNSGLSLDKLQKLLGHSKPETTMIYAKLNLELLQQEHRRIYQ